MVRLISVLDIVLRVPPVFVVDSIFLNGFGMSSFKVSYDDINRSTIPTGITYKFLGLPIFKTTVTVTSSGVPITVNSTPSNIYWDSDDLNQSNTASGDLIRGALYKFLMIQVFYLICEY